MKTKTVKQTVTIEAPPSEVYEALMDSKKHAQLIGAQASISRKVGGKIKAYDGYIEGENLELVPDEKIVQAWRASDWPEGHFSEATVELTETMSGTKLVFTQKRVPEERFEDIRQGWLEYYWEPLKEILESN